MRRPRSGRGATAASGPGVRVTPEARSPAACSGVLRCAVSKCPPLASVESADAAWRPAGAHERPMGARRDRRYGHRCPHTFCPLTDSVKSRRTRSDLDGGVLVRSGPGAPRARPAARANDAILLLMRYGAGRLPRYSKGERSRGVLAAGGGHGGPRRPAGSAWAVGRRGRPALARTPMACDPRDLPVTRQLGMSPSWLLLGQRCRQSRVWKP
jgi:hypothetical protein